MATSRLSTGLLLGIALAAALGSARPATAGFLNGDFSNGLDKWSTSGVMFTGESAVSADAGQAKLRESDDGFFSAFTVTLYQDVTLGTGDDTIVFQLRAFTTEPMINGRTPDFFNVALLDPLTG